LRGAVLGVYLPVDSCISQNEVRRAWQFRFDWWIKSRTPQELGHRVDALIKLIQKESEQAEAKKKQKVCVHEHVRITKLTLCAESGQGEGEEKGREAKRKGKERE
jgi:hypothetical protein